MLAVSCVQGSDGICRLILNRLETRNALTADMIRSITDHLNRLKTMVLAHPEQVRIVVLQGQGPVFCAGADLNEMRSYVTKSYAENQEDANLLASLFWTIASFPVPVLALAQGSAMGGAVGILACCDFVFADEHLKFMASEIRIGLVPAVISPYIVRRVGVAHATAIMMSGKHFSAQRGYEMGLIYHIASTAQLVHDSELFMQNLLTMAPLALQKTKQLILKALPLPDSSVMEFCKDCIAKTRTSPEALAGIQKFFEKKS